MSFGDMRNLLCRLVMFVMALGFVACSDDDDPVLPSNEGEEMAEYTIMLYGCGGGDLDEAMIANLEEAELVGSDDKVKMTCQVKFSEAYQSVPELSGTCRFVLDENGDGESDDEVVMDASLPLYDPANLADFIRWSKEKCPAKNYILVLWNHGGGWYPATDMPKTKAVIFDDNVGNLALSLDELVAGVKQSDTHLKMLYYDACLMGMLENYAGLTEITDYVLGSAHSVPGLGGNYTSLIENLRETADFEEAISRYVHEVVSIWGVAGDVCDLGLADLSALPNVLSVVKTCADRLVETYEDNQEMYDAATDYCYRFDNTYSSFDIENYVQLLANFSNDPELIGYAARLQRAFDNMFVYQELSRDLVSEGMSISLGVTLIENGRWMRGNGTFLDWDGSITDDKGNVLVASWGSTGDDTYGQLAFDQATGWSRWLKLNQQLPTNNPGPSDDDDDDDDHPEGDVVDGNE